MALEDEDSDTIHYVMLRAVNRFLSEYNRYPGSDQHTVEADVPKLKVALQSSICVACIIKVLFKESFFCMKGDRLSSSMPQKSVYFLSVLMPLKLLTLIFPGLCF